MSVTAEESDDAVTRAIERRRRAIEAEWHELGAVVLRDMPVHVPIFDWLFLGIGGIGLLVIGWMMMGAARHNRVAPAARRP